MNNIKTKYENASERAAQLAYEFEKKYFGCSQATLAALIQAFGVGGTDLLRSSTCLAGGIARRGHVCGGLTGGLLMIGYLTGRDDLEMFSQYGRAMEYGNTLYDRFQEELGSVNCSEIQKIKYGREFDLQNQDDREELHRKMSEMDDGCQAVTSAAARITAEIISEIFRKEVPFAEMLVSR